MKKHLVRAAAALVATAALTTALATPASAYTREACRNIGNGDVCIKLENINNSSNRADITVWFSKHAGDPVVVRLAHFPGDGIDEGAFTIYAGQVRGYKWNNVYLSTYNGWTGALRQGGAPNWSVVINGGTAYRW